MRRMMIVAFSLAGACASGGAPPGAGGAASPAAIYTSPETGTLFADRPTVATTTIGAAPAVVWNALKKAYAELEIPVAVEDAAAHQIGNTNIVKTRQLAGSSMSNWISCGSSVTGEKANEYRIYASLLTDALPDAKGGTALRTTLTASARDVEGGTTSRIACTSTGRLEQALFDRVNAAIAKG